MSTLFSIFNTAGQTLNAFERLMSSSQNNVSNASTPGYARQDAVAVSLPFQANNNLAGGVKAASPQDSRSQFAEQSVRNQTSSSGFYSQLASSLGPLDGLFDVSGKTGISGALNGLFDSFSGWSTAPSSASARQGVLTAAQNVADSFRQAGAAVSRIRTGVDSDLAATVDQINQLAAQVQQYNKTKLSNVSPDAGLDANLYASLESLSKYANFVPLFQSNGSVTVLLGGQTPLVIGDQLNPVTLSYPPVANPQNPNAVPQARVQDSEGRDISSSLSEGQLGALLRVRNQEISSLIGDGSKPGSLNILARKVADQVNGLLTSGQTTTDPPQNGLPLFTYDSSDAANVINTLSVNASVTADRLAPADPGPPPVSNGVALKLAGLPQSPNAADQVNGVGILNYYSSIAAQTGQSISDANNANDRATNMLAQTKSLRNQLSGVSLDQEAIRLVELQRSYQAAARVVSVVSDMTDSLLQIR